MTLSYHEPVLTSEVLDALRVTPGKKYIDGTVGGGGHSVEILKRGGILLGIDTDGEAVEHTKEEFRIRNKELRIKDNWKIIQGNFRDIEAIAKENGFSEVAGILFDLGVSSHQLDTPERGFSYRFASAPLDLRLNQGSGETAAQLVHRASEEQLYEIFATFGEEERAGAIARALVRARSVNPVRLTADLVRIIESAGIAKSEVSGVSSRIFQALRIAVNDELSALEEAIAGARRLLVSGGRLAIISFHSLEDRIVKRKMKETGWSVISRKPITASPNETEKNRRSRSAKLRIAEKHE